jgi:hypothetical protein
LTHCADVLTMRDDAARGRPTRSATATPDIIAPSAAAWSSPELAALIAENERRRQAEFTAAVERPHDVTPLPKAGSRSIVRTTLVAPPLTCLTASMAATDDPGDIDMTVDTEMIDVDGDGITDMVVETTTTLIDVDGDGAADVVSETTTTMYDLDGDGVADAVEETTITAIDIDGDGVADAIEITTISATDVDGDGQFSDDEIQIEEVTAVRKDLLEDLDD